MDSRNRDITNDFYTNMFTLSLSRTLNRISKVYINDIIFPNINDTVNNGNNSLAWQYPSKNFLGLNNIDQSINEAYTEYLAVLHHIAIISFYTNKSPYLIYHYEKLWSMYQVCKILKHYNMNKFDDLQVNKFVQETNVFSYYIIKFFLLWKLDNKCSSKTLINILDDQDIIKVINQNMNLQFDKNLRMTLFELK